MDETDKTESWGDALERAKNIKPGETIKLPDGTVIKLEENDDVSVRRGPGEPTP